MASDVAAGEKERCLATRRAGTSAVLGLLGIGLFGFPFIVVVVYPDQYVNAQFELRLLCAMGAAVLGGVLVNLLGSEKASASAVSAIVVLQLFFAFDLPAAVDESINHRDLCAPARAL
jgi:hypothetical protein